MLDKEAFCLIAQAIYDDLLLSFVGQGSLRRHIVQPTVATHKIFFVCRFPSAINTSHYQEDLKVISEDEMGILQSAVGRHPVCLCCLISSSDAFPEECPTTIP